MNKDFLRRNRIEIYMIIFCLTGLGFSFVLGLQTLFLEKYYIGLVVSFAAIILLVVILSSIREIQRREFNGR